MGSIRTVGRWSRAVPRYEPWPTLSGVRSANTAERAWIRIRDAGIGVRTCTGTEAIRIRACTCIDLSRVVNIPHLSSTPSVQRSVSGGNHPTGANYANSDVERRIKI
jgi:hypothetical protein